MEDDALRLLDLARCQSDMETALDLIERVRKRYMGDPNLSFVMDYMTTCSAILEAKQAVIYVQNRISDDLGSQQ